MVPMDGRLAGVGDDDDQDVTMSFELMHNREKRNAEGRQKARNCKGKWGNGYVFETLVLSAVCARSQDIIALLDTGELAATAAVAACMRRAMAIQ